MLTPVFCSPPPIASYVVSHRRLHLSPTLNNYGTCVLWLDALGRGLYLITGKRRPNTKQRASGNVSCALVVGRLFPLQWQPGLLLPPSFPEQILLRNVSPLTSILFLYRPNQTAVILLLLQDSGRQGGGRRAQEQCRPHGKAAQRGPILEHQIDGRTSGGQVAVSTALGSEKLLHPWQCRAVHSDPAGEVDTELLQDAARKENAPAAVSSKA